MKADYNISIDNLIFDANVSNQTANDYNLFGVYLRRVSGLSITNCLAKNCRDGFVINNCYDVCEDNLSGENVGTLVQHTGSGGRIAIGKVSGMSWDDHLSFLIGDYPNFADVTNGTYLGDFDGINIAGVNAKNSYRLLKLTGQTGFRFSSFYCGSLVGRSALGGAAVLSIGDDSGIQTMAQATGATGTTIGGMSFGAIVVDTPGGAAPVIGISAPGGADNISIDTISLTNMPNVAGTTGVTLSGAITEFNVGKITVSASVYSSSIYGVVLATGSNVVDVNVGILSAININIPVIQSTGVTAGNINIDKLVTKNCGIGLQTGTNGSYVNVNYAERNGYQSSPFFNLNGNCDINVPSGRGLYATDAFGGSATSKAIHNCLGIAVDVGGTGVIRQAGAMCYHKTATARGTLVTDNIVVCDATGAANSWKQLSDTTKTY